MTHSTRVVITTFNRRDQVCSAVESVLAQAATASEVVVVDDGSTDGTVEVLGRRFGAKLRIIKTPGRMGPAFARNLGAEGAATDYIAFLDDDDKFTPNHLSDAVDAFNAFDEVGLVFGKTHYYKSEAKIEFMESEQTNAVSGLAERKKGEITLLSDRFFNDLLVKGCFLNPSSVVIRASVFHECGGFDPSIVYAEDWEFWCRVSVETRVAYVSNVQCHCQVLGQGMTNDGDREADYRRSKGKYAAWSAIAKRIELSNEQRELVQIKRSRHAFDAGWWASEVGWTRQSMKHYWDSLRCEFKTKTLFALAKCFIKSFLRSK